MKAKAYKLFRCRDGVLYPLYVYASEPMPIGVWLEAKDGERDGDKVKSRLGRLAYRPGFHLAEVPNAHWIGKRQDGELVMRSDTIWCEVEYKTDRCYSSEARENGWKAGKWAANRAYLKHIPVGGYYKYRTNSNGDVWIIRGEIKIIRILPDEERKRICIEHGITPQRKETA